MNILWKVINFVLQPDHGKYLLVLLRPVCGAPPHLIVAHQAYNHFPPLNCCWLVIDIVLLDSCCLKIDIILMDRCQFEIYVVLLDCCP